MVSVNNRTRGTIIMNSTIRRACFGMLLGTGACLVQTVAAQTGPVLEARMYAGTTVTGTVSATYMIEATTNLSLTNGWVALTCVVLPSGEWSAVSVGGHNYAHYA